MTAAPGSVTAGLALIEVISDRVFIYGRAAGRKSAIAGYMAIVDIPTLSAVVWAAA